MYSEETMQRMALLKTAREQLNNQYIQERAAAFAQWSTDCDRVWKESGIKLPFPPPGPVPSESDVVAYALALYNAQNPPAQPAPQPAPVSTPPVHIVHTVVESVVAPAPTITPAKEKLVHEEPVAPPVPVVEIIEPTELSVHEPVVAIPATSDVVAAVPVALDTLVEPIPAALILPTPVPGAADFDKGEAAIKEIFATPTADPTTMTSGTPSPSVLPLIKSMLKKGLLPSWVKSSDAGIKE